jgi:hypothetical protein
MAEFEWVKERAKCSAVEMFKKLELGARSDVDAVNSLRSPGDHIKFSVAEQGNRFSVIRESDLANKSAAVDFALNQSIIDISDGVLVHFSALVTLNNDGECKLLVKDQELELWQVRRKALENLFFSEIHVTIERIGRQYSA